MMVLLRQVVTPMLSSQHARSSLFDGGAFSWSSGNDIAINEHVDDNRHQLSCRSFPVSPPTSGIADVVEGADPES
jgi:hypothetical protein